MRGRLAQATIFIIIAIVFIAGIVGYFLLKDRLSPEGIPATFEPVYNSFMQCFEDEVVSGIDILESHGGYIELPEFEPGSSYMPFGSQLNFLGNPIPYWYYVSGNNLEKEQVPSNKEMEEQLGNFISERIKGCVFEDYYRDDFEIFQGEPYVNVDVRKSSVVVSVDMDLTLTKGGENILVKTHKVEVESEFGALYADAREVYENEMNTLFLEDYAVDNLRLYAPVDGVEMTCSPLTWGADEVFENLKSAIESNTNALKVKGGDYDIEDKDKYFVVDLGVDSDVRFLNSANWSEGFEVAPAEGNLLISNPVGNQQGLGILGFCYVPYHFVYNVRYPVLIQVYRGDEIFQFPVAVVLQGNKPREAFEAEAVESQSFDICAQKNTEIGVSVYDMNSNPVDAVVSFECFGSRCLIGQTQGGFLFSEFPQCVNGYIVAEADGYMDARQIYDTVESGQADIFMNRLHEVEVDLNIDKKSSDSKAIISFVSGDLSKTIVYPETKKVELGEGQYNISVYVYEESDLKLDASSTQQCVEVPREGLGALFGLTEERCFDVEVPESIVSNALSAGGKQSYYLLESELENANVVEINAESLPEPSSLEQLQENYILFEHKGLEVEFK